MAQTKALLFPHPIPSPTAPLAPPTPVPTTAPGNPLSSIFPFPGFPDQTGVNPPSITSLMPGNPQPQNPSVPTSPGDTNQPAPPLTQNPPDGSNPPATGNTAAAPMPQNQATTPNEQIGNPTGQQAGLSFAQVENYWIQAGGNAQAAAMAAAVADAESGLNAAAQRTNPDGSVGVGLWLIPQNGTPPGSTDPLANARAAVQLSQNGTDWTQWCSTWSDNNCGENNGTYLGQGANALMSLAGQKPGAAYNVFGSTPSSTGVGASSATSGLSGATGGTSSKSKLLPFVIIIIVVGVIFWAANRKSQAQPAE